MPLLLEAMRTASLLCLQDCILLLEVLPEKGLEASQKNLSSMEGTTIDGTGIIATRRLWPSRFQW